MASKDELNSRPRDWLSNSQVKGLVAMVVGGGSGIGAATAETLAVNGARIVVADRRKEPAETVAEAIRKAGGEAVAVAMDVSAQADIDAGVKATIDAYGQLDILVNSAGVIFPGSLEDCSLDEWRTSFLVNVDGALLLARACLPHLRKSKAASVVNISSLAGGRGYPNGGAYGPSKAALISLTRQMALEWAQDGIRVNVVSPGTIDTPLTRANMRPEIIADREAKIPLGRLGVATELADTVCFLASPAASFVTAQEVCCDGGLSQSLMAQKFYANK
ncbi:MAG: SDR family oxidoreductase [Rhizobiaceae bacterium]|nr:SDR family oxidoreductase [Rhizobiaceae bacterium]MCV0404900.1 SDR family oxidoreductase [Rhizobiaceae bacterium]